MNVSGRNGRSRPTRLNTFEILRLILEAIDHDQIPAGPTGTPSFRTIWTTMSGPIERGRWTYAWNFLCDEEMVDIDPGVEVGSLWKLNVEGKILLDLLRGGSFSSTTVHRDRRSTEARAGTGDHTIVPHWRGRHH